VAVPPEVVTETVTVPAEPAGAVILIVVAVLALMVAGLLPKVTLAPARFVPVIFTSVPLVIGPLTGEMLVMVGAGNVTLMYDDLTRVELVTVPFPAVRLTE
jgi:hypothetical protein